MRSAVQRHTILSRTALSMMASLLARRQRSFRSDALAATGCLKRELQVLNPVTPKQSQGTIVIVNHYTRPGLGAWWLALALSASFPAEIHWIITSAWVYPDRLRSWSVTPLSKWALRLIAQTYRFTSMPPMPPRAHETQARSQAIRGLLRFVNENPHAAIGLAPEGADSGDSALARPPSGVGRLLHLLMQRGLRVIPVGVYEQAARLTVSYGNKLPVPQSVPTERRARDRILTDWTMRAIAERLPEELRGPYA
jgi:hypothetical protein